ncbi:hypothetical protein CEXT_379121 [Caerostris extrusa]|uniref:Uncharacterized protein n=1 Tax=Caerostris extrusa TaxID=172846 RepID=A0AAV4Y4Y6_CAEEX|nr:hypothetical protein CEXT_379121 [Caerostris extrusa]
MPADQESTQFKNVTSTIASTQISKTMTSSISLTQIFKLMMSRIPSTQKAIQISENDMSNIPSTQKTLISLKMMCQVYHQLKSHSDFCK